MHKLYRLTWPVARLGEILEILSRRGDLISRPIPVPSALPTALNSNAALDRWIDYACDNLGIEVEATMTPYNQLDQFLRNASPAIIRWPNGPETLEPRFLAVSGAKWGQVSVIGPSLKRSRVSLQTLHDLFCRDLEGSIQQGLRQFLTQLEVPDINWGRARKALTHENIVRNGLDGQPVATAWLLRPAPRETLWRQARHERIFKPFLIVLGTFIPTQILFLGSWGIIGWSVFQEHFEWAWLLAWSLITLTSVHLGMLTQDNQNKFVMRGAGLFKRQLLYGTLQLDLDKIHHQGAGQFLGRVMESESLEALVTTGGMAAVVGLIVLLLDGIVLGLGAGGWIHAGLLLIWTLLTLFFAWRYFRIGNTWIAAYRDMTNELVEGMVGHRTRLVQEKRKDWHVDEDRLLDIYLTLSEKLDRIENQLETFIPRTWMLVGFAGTTFPLLSGVHSPTKLALSIGGTLFAFQALTGLTTTLNGLIGALMAWSQVEPIMAAAARPHQGKARIVALEPEASENGPALLLARDITFRYREHGPPIIRAGSLVVKQGDRILLEGPSGGGKSTLAAVLAGLYEAESGLLLLRGQDRETIGPDAWRRRVLVVPQFQDNHIFTETLGFNLLLGRRWPPLPEDLEEAEAICRELGLGHLLDQMPARFEQRIGESGWRLSHGERSRVFIARALLQDADLLILDESFGALDPETMQNALHCVLNRASTIMVIAHP